MKACVYLEYDAMAELIGRGQLGLVVADGHRDEAVSEQLLKKRQRRAGGIVSSSFHAGCQILNVSRGKKCSSPLSNIYIPRNRGSHFIWPMIREIITLKIAAIFCCWGREQWFSMERMTGRGEATNADSAIVCTTSRNEILVVSVWPW